MHLWSRATFVCQSCQKLQPRIQVGGRLTSRLASARNITTAAPRNQHDRPFRLAVIGSGPAGFYSAYRVMSKIQDAVVDMYEQLPVPYGLARFGVAPDHPEVKNCQDKFEEVASSPRFNFVGNVRVGQDVPLTRLVPHYDAILFAYGASKDKALGIPGENLSGVYSARAFVGWYNGLPEYSHLDPQLEAGEEAVLIGQGNVSLDVARMLLSDVDALRKTDITENALERLSKSRVKSVKIVGRRGLLQAAFTIKEARELMALPNTYYESIDQNLIPPDPSKLPRQLKRMVQVLNQPSTTALSEASRRWAFQFLLSPTSFEPSSASASALSSVSFEKTAFLAEADPFVRDAKVVGTGQLTSLPAALAFRSIGYKSEAIPGFADVGIPFDEQKGIIPNDVYGRVIHPDTGPGGSLTAGHVSGMYCAGWVKRGPTGVIATTMEDAFRSADVIAMDWEQQVPFLNKDGQGTGSGWEGVRKDLEANVRPISWEDWKIIDAVEKEKGKAAGKAREKFSRVEDMLKVLDG